MQELVNAEASKPTTTDGYAKQYATPKGSKRTQRSDSSQSAPPPKKSKTVPVAASQTTPPLWQHTPEDSSSEDDLPMMTSHKRRKSTHVTPPVAVAASTTTTRRASSPTILAVEAPAVAPPPATARRASSPSISTKINPEELSEDDLLHLLKRRRALASVEPSAKSSHPFDSFASAKKPSLPSQEANNSSSFICRCGMEIEKDLAEFHTCPRAVVAQKPTKTPEDWDTDDEIEFANKQMEASEVMTEKGIKYAEATVHSKGHKQRRSVMVAGLTDTILKNKDELKSLAEMVPDKNGQLVPKAFLALSGPATVEKATLASKILFRWLEEMRNSRAKDGECPFLQPNAQGTYLRTLLGVMKEEHGWNLSLERDFNMQGGLQARMRLLFEERAKEWPGVYGVGSKVQVPKNVASSGDVDLSVFDESDLTEHQIKALLIFGLFFGFRGRKEHVDLKIPSIDEGVFPDDHEFGGQAFIGVTGFTDKARKLSLTTPIMRNTKGMMRIPADPDDMSCPGGCLKRLLQKAGPGQERFYCHPAQPSEKRMFASRNYPDAEMSPHKPIGVNPIGKMIKSGAQRVGLDVTGQGLRRVFVTTMVNAPGVNENESLASARHSSVAAQRPYMSRNSVSEAAKFSALGLKKGKGGGKGGDKGAGK